MELRWPASITSTDSKKGTGRLTKTAKDEEKLQRQDPAPQDQQIANKWYLIRKSGCFLCLKSFVMAVSDMLVASNMNSIKRVSIIRDEIRQYRIVV